MCHLAVDLGGGSESDRAPVQMNEKGSSTIKRISFLFITPPPAPFPIPHDDRLNPSMVLYQLPIEVTIEDFWGAGGGAADG